MQTESSSQSISRMHSSRPRAPLGAAPLNTPSPPRKNRTIAVNSASHRSTSAPRTQRGTLPAVDDRFPAAANEKEKGTPLIPLLLEDGEEEGQRWNSPDDLSSLSGEDMSSGGEARSSTTVSPEMTIPSSSCPFASRLSELRLREGGDADLPTPPETCKHAHRRRSSLIPSPQELLPSIEDKSVKQPQPEAQEEDEEYRCDTRGDEDVLGDIYVPFPPHETDHEPRRPLYSLLLLRQHNSLWQLFTLACAIVVFPFVCRQVGVAITDGLISLFLVWFIKYLHTNISFWAAHMRPDEEECRNVRNAATKPFLSRRVEVRDHHVLKNKKVWAPLVDKEHVTQRAFCTVGLSLCAYLRDLFTYAIEYKVQAVWHAIAVDLRLGRYNRKPSMDLLYKFVINTSLACYIDAQTGHAVFYDTCLPFKQSESKVWHKITVELDHPSQRCVRLLMQESKPKAGERATVVVVDDAMESNCVLMQVGMLKSHVHVHWFSNGVAELTDSWRFADEAADMVQGLNNGSVFSTGGVYMNSTATMQEITGHNALTEGLPIHNDLTFIAKNSGVHKMAIKARVGLYQALPEVPRIQIEALIAATIMHSADHFYTDEITPFYAKSKLLQCDFTLARSTVVGPYRYLTRRLLCREHLDDDVCRVLYTCAAQYDAKFANEALFLSVAN